MNSILTVRQFARQAVARLGRWVRHDERGMSILETLIATLIGLIVSGAALQSYLTIHGQSIVQDQVTEMQQSARAAMRVMSAQMRMAGFALPGTIDALAGTNTNPDSITISHVDVGDCEAPTSAAMGSKSDPLVCTGFDVSCFAAGMRVYVFDAVAGVGEFFNVASVDNGAHSITPAGALGRTYPTSSRVYHIEQISYYLDRSDSLHPALMEKPAGSAAQVYAENIEDLQFSYIMKAGDTVQTLLTPSLVRDVLVSLTARTARLDNDVAKGYRRRTFDFGVSVRNHE